MNGLYFIIIVMTIQNMIGALSLPWIAIAAVAITIIAYSILSAINEVHYGS